jgi:hypothetical protein
VTSPGSDSTYRSIHGGTAAPPSCSIGSRSLLCSDRRSRIKSLGSGPVRFPSLLGGLIKTASTRQSQTKPMACHRAGEVHQQRSPTVRQPGLTEHRRRWSVSTSDIGRFDRDVSRAVAVWEGGLAAKAVGPWSSVYRTLHLTVDCLCVVYCEPAARRERIRSSDLRLAEHGSTPDGADRQEQSG